MDYVDAIAHVVSYDFPRETPHYVYRIGRTGPAGDAGKATTFVTARDELGLQKLEKLLGRSIRLPQGGGGGNSRGRRSLVTRFAEGVHFQAIQIRLNLQAFSRKSVENFDI